MKWPQRKSTHQRDPPTGSVLQRPSHDPPGERRLPSYQPDAHNSPTLIRRPAAPPTGGNVARYAPFAGEGSGTVAEEAATTPTLLADKDQLVETSKPSAERTSVPATGSTTHDPLYHKQQLPDLSNLWSRTKEGQLHDPQLQDERNSRSFRGSTNSNNNESVTIRYPVIEDMLLPDTDELLSRCVKNKTEEKTSAPEETQNPKTSSTIGSTSGVATKPGAVAVTGNASSSSAYPSQNAKEMDKDKKARVEPAESHDSNGITTLPAAKVVYAAFLLEDKVGHHGDDQDKASGSNSKNCPTTSATHETQNESTVMSLSLKPNDASVTKASLLDDDDDQDTSVISGQHSILSTATAPSSLCLDSQTLDQKPFVWGRKAPKATLEDDTPDVRELAFAEGASPLPRMENNSSPLEVLESPPSKSQQAQLPSHEKGEDSAVAASAVTAETLSTTKSVASSKPKSKSEMSEDEILRAVLEESKKTALEDTSRQQEQPCTVLSMADLEEIRENARTLLSLLADNHRSDTNVDLGFLQTVLDMCQADQRRVARSIQDATIDIYNSSGSGDDAIDLEILIDLNASLLDAVEAGEKVIRDNQKQPSRRRSSSSRPSINISTDNFDVQDLVDKRDIFSLICMLRVQQSEKRLDAALALLQFARAAERDHEDHTSVALRNEIRSSGGLHSLLTVFGTRGIRYELRVVTALAVAYVLPSFVEPSSLSASPSLGLKIVESLRFLSSAQSVSHQGETLSANEHFAAAGMALTTFWVVHLEPMLLQLQQSIKRGGSTSETEDSFTGTIAGVGVAGVGGTSTNPYSLPRQRSRGGAMSDQLRQQEAIAGDELLETTVSLIIDVAKRETEETTSSTKITSRASLTDSAESSPSSSMIAAASFKWSHHLIEQVCALEIARPMAVRKGCLQILVTWIRSTDRERIRSAVSALRYLTSVNDKYMAGWIHSEMINKGAVEGLAELTQDLSITHDVRLAIAQILSSLCAAPHTRAAVLEANCFQFLIGILYEHNIDPSSEELALFAGSAILQLAAGAIARASAFSQDDHDVIGLTSPDRRDSLISNIIESGAISSFVSIAKATRNSKLRSVAVQSLRVISEDINPVRQTRLRLFEYGTAMALGVTLKNNIALLGDTLQNESVVPRELQHSLWDLQEALCALGNIFDPDQENTPMTHSVREISSSSVKDPQQLLTKGCLETANSGGLDSLIQITNLPFQSNDKGSCNEVLVEEACRSLSSMAPLLLTTKVATAGYSKFAYDVMLAFHNLLVHLSREEWDKSATKAQSTEAELLVSVLQGISALSKSEPLKVRIIDRSLPYLLQARNSQYQSDIAMAAAQTFQSLNLADDEITAQVVGNTPNVFAEWFSLQRSLLMQAMVRDEIRRVVQIVWGAPFEEMSHGSSELKLYRPPVSFIAENDQKSTDNVLFANLADDSDSVVKRDLLLAQYRNMYEARYTDGSLPLNGSWEDIDEGLLSQQTYPLNSRETETKWILEHGRSATGSETVNCSAACGSVFSEHVEKILSVYFPSRLLRDSLIPVVLMRPDASFNFRALMMAQRGYFSFRREGQLLAVLCDREANALGLDGTHWTLGFTNSSFAGEFAESLLQVLYKCPVICGLSFVRNADWREKQEVGNTDGSGMLLANLVGSLPPWISHLTFEGYFDGSNLTALVQVFETLGMLITGNGGLVGRRLASTNEKIQFLAVRHSPNIADHTWHQFFNLLGGNFNVPSSVPSSPSVHPLVLLKALDLSDNRLGDDLCADILRVVFDVKSVCSLEDLDLSGNDINCATRTLQILQTYCNMQSSGTGSMNAEWKSSLKNLRLRSNCLNRGNAWLEILKLLQYDGLGLTELDLAANGISVGRSEIEDADIMLQSLTASTSIRRLDLSDNQFSSSVVDHIIEFLAEKDFGFVIVQLQNNAPPLTRAQIASLEKISFKTRKRVLHQYLQNRRGRMAKDLDYKSILSLHNSVIETPIDEERAIKASAAKFHTAPSERPAVDNSITVLFSAPLVFTDGHSLRPFAKLDFDMERELMWQCLKEASRDISLSFDSATHDRLLACMTKRCSCLHYSGHGHQQYLPFEDGSGGPYWFKVDQFKSLIEREGGAPFRFVFVSACYSYLAGETFASAGVPHVVCCQQESELKDTAALAFTRQFYLALAVGHTVKAAFDQGCKAVRATPNLRDPDAEMKKFLLLPADGDHDVPIFNADPVAEWPRILGDETGRLGRRLSYRSTRGLPSGAKRSELSVRNMMQVDPSPSPPEFFIGREVDMYYVLKAVLAKRLVSVVGETGVGRSSLVCALCHYINERATTMIAIDHIYYVKAPQKRKSNVFRSLVQRFLKKIVEEKNCPPIDPEADMESMFEAICRNLKHDKALVVFDRIELVVNADNANDFPMLLSKLCRETKNIKVLVTNHHSLGIPSLGEHPISLGPLNFADTVRLFTNLCPYLHTPAERRKMYESLVRDEEMAELLATDPGLRASASRIFAILGDGVPSRIEKAAYDLSKEDFLRLYKATTADYEYSITVKTID